MSKYTKQQCDEVINLYLSGYTYPEIENKTGFTKSTIYKIRKKFNIETRKWRKKKKITEFDKNLDLKITETYKLGKTYDEICTQFQLKDHGRIAKALERTNTVASRHKEKRQYFTQEQIKFIKESYSIYGGHYCAEYLKIEYRRIKNVVKKLKINRVFITENDKLCSKCKEILSLDNFFNDKGKKCGKASWCITCCKTYYNSHPEEMTLYRRTYKRDRRKNDPVFKLRERLRQLVRDSLRRHGAKKAYKTEKLTGCKLDFLIEHIESTFLKGMNWENYGKVWNIDHIKALANFTDLTNPEQQLEASHYTNLRALWVTTEIAHQYGDFVNIGNLNKSNRIIISPTSSSSAPQGAACPSSCGNAQILSA